MTESKDAVILAKTILVSACLLGLSTRYDGKSKTSLIPNNLFKT